MEDRSKKAYVNNPDHCPVCNSECISAGDYDFDGKEVWSLNCCETCNTKWKDTYILKKFEIIN